MVNLLKAGKGKEVSYNALATHIIAEDGDNPEVGESREVFDLPVVKVCKACSSNFVYLFIYFIYCSWLLIEWYDIIMFTNYFYYWYQRQQQIFCQI